MRGYRSFRWRGVQRLNRTGLRRVKPPMPKAKGPCVHLYAHAFDRLVAAARSVGVKPREMIAWLVRDLPRLPRARRPSELARRAA